MTDEPCVPPLCDPLPRATISGTIVDGGETTMTDEYEELWCPSIDVCAWCSDSECDGIACIASLDPDSPDDREAIESLHAYLRRGRLAWQAEVTLAQAENRRYP